MIANALIMPRLLLKLLAHRPIKQPSSKQPVAEPLHLHIARLEHILQQVRKDGFHVEYIHDLGWKDAETGEIIAAVDRWAKYAGARISVNRELGIFFFEQG